MPSKQRLNITIRGKVQAVGFRYYAKQLADKLNLKGYAQNQGDDSVFIDVEGPGQALKQFVAWCQTGPDRAEATDIQYNTEKIVDYQDFEIR